MAHEARVVEDPIIRFIEDELGGYAVKIHGGTFQKRGVPDIIASINGIFCGIECKREEKAYLTPVQKKNLIEIVKSGGVGIVARSLDEFKEMYYHPKKYQVHINDIEIYSDTQYFGVFVK